MKVKKQIKKIYKYIQKLTVEETDGTYGSLKRVALKGSTIWATVQKDRLSSKFQLIMRFYSGDSYMGSAILHNSKETGWYPVELRIPTLFQDTPDRVLIIDAIPPHPFQVVHLSEGKDINDFSLSDIFDPDRITAHAVQKLVDRYNVVRKVWSRINKLYSLVYAIKDLKGHVNLTEQRIVERMLYLEKAMYKKRSQGTWYAARYAVTYSKSRATKHLTGFEPFAEAVSKDLKRIFK